MHLVGFTIEIYYDARPYERQIWHLAFACSSNKYLFLISEQSNDIDIGFYALLLHGISLK